MKEIVIGGIYEHYKKKRYKVIGIARHSETLEELVVYQALYGKGDLWVRPYNMFAETIVKDGNKIERFSYVDIAKVPVRIDLELPEDIKTIMYQYHLNLENELLDVSSELEFEYSGDDSGSKDAVLIILASGVTAAAVILAVTKLVGTILERPRLVDVIEKNSQGDIIKEGKALLEPNREPQKIELNLEAGTQGIKVTILDESGK